MQHSRRIIRNCLKTYFLRHLSMQSNFTSHMMQSWVEPKVIAKVCKNTSIKIPLLICRPVDSTKSKLSTHTRRDCGNVLSFSKDWFMAVCIK